MVLNYVEDVLLDQVAWGLKHLANSILCHMTTTPSSSSSGTYWPQMSCRMLSERLLLLHYRSKDVLADFSGYYCLRLLLDVRSPHATYFIDLFHELEWLLEALVIHRMQFLVDNSMSRSEDLYDKTITLLRCIRPAVNSCRYLFVVSEISKPADGITVHWHKYESSLNFSQKRKEILRGQVKLLIDREESGIRRSQEKLLKKVLIDREESGIRRSQVKLLIDRVKKRSEFCSILEEIRRAQEEICRRQEEICMEREEIYMKRKAEAHRDLPMDSFHAGLKLLPFGNLDNYSVSNRVELGRKLGEGGFSVVYEGKFMIPKDHDQTQQIIGQPVAVKVFRSEISESEGCIFHTREVGSQFFKRMEATASRDFFDQTDELSEELWNLVTAKHPNIVSALGYIGRRDEGESGLVMELMSTSLQEYLEEVAEPVKEQDMVDIMLETAKGMRFLHECDLAHRDLKPRNILLRSCKRIMHGTFGRCEAGGMEVKLADFGLAQHIITKGDAQGLETDASSRPGTYCYMAPELLRYTEFPPSSQFQDKMDVFSYGTTCFNILTCKDAGALDFTCASSKASAFPFYEVVRSGDWRAWVKGKPEYLIDLIARCWAFDPCQRPTFAAICCLLQRAMLCILAPPMIDEEVLVKARSRNVLRDMFETIAESSDTKYEVIGTSRMERCLENFTKFTYISLNTSLGGSSRSSFLGELRDHAIAFREQWRYKGSKINTRRTKDTIARGVMAQKPLAAPRKNKLGSSAESGSACGNLETIVDADQYGSNTLTSKAVIRLRLKQGPAQDQARVGAQQYLQIPLTTMDPQWNVCKALVCCSIFFSRSNHGPSAFCKVEYFIIWSKRAPLPISERCCQNGSRGG